MSPVVLFVGAPRLVAAAPAYGIAAVSLPETATVGAAMATMVDHELQSLDVVAAVTTPEGAALAAALAGRHPLGRVVQVATVGAAPVPDAVAVIPDGEPGAVLAQALSHFASSPPLPTPTGIAGVSTPARPPPPPRPGPMPVPPAPPPPPVRPVPPLPPAPAPAPPSPPRPPAPAPAAVQVPPSAAPPESEPLPAPEIEPEPVPDVVTARRFAASPFAEDDDDAAALRGTVLAVTSAKGGVGKTTLTLWVGEALTAANRRVCVVDCNLAQADILKRVGRWSSQHLGLGRFLSAHGRITDTQVVGELVEVDRLGHIMPGPPGALMTPDERTELMRRTVEVINRLKRRFEWVIVDSPVASTWDSIHNLVIREVADQVLVVVDPTQTTIHDVRAWMAEAVSPVHEGGQGLPQEMFVGVMNMADEHLSSVTLDKARGWLPSLRIVGEIPNVPAVTEATNRKKWWAPTQARQSMLDLVHEVCCIDMSDISAGEGRARPAQQARERGGRLGGLRRRRR